ncbi:MAG: exosome complex RNA-binding protein Csl4 [Methanohalobium sp.]|uniref:exosome complex RNA-binding protein Csl4 n=1 Tax=Methanohalobium sp. TaxID=2837493 RepID=UPI00397A5C97
MEPEEPGEPEDSEPVLVMPGDFVGTTEEFIPGEGTYIYYGNIHSLVTGKVIVDEKTHSVSVVPKTKTPPSIKEGDIVIGGITDVRDSVAIVGLEAIKDKGEREFQGTRPAAIHVSNVKDAYVKKLSDEFAPFDIIKGKIKSAKNLNLSTSEESLGVMKAYCSNCKSAMVKNDNKLKCPYCGNVENRKLSSDYGTGII